MENRKMSNLLFIIGFFLFQILFWQQDIGLNIVFFTIFSLIALLLSDISRWESNYFKMTVIGTSLLSFFVVWNNSHIAFVSYWLSWFLMVGIAYGRELYYALYGLMQGAENILMSPQNLRKLFVWERNSSNDSEGFVPERTAGLRPSLFVIPAIILFIFGVMYAVGNQDFAENIGAMLKVVFQKIGWLLRMISFDRLPFTILTVFMIGGLVWKNSSDRWSNAQHGHVMDIATPETIPSMTQANDRYWTAFLTLAMLNILIFIVNMTDFFKIFQPQDINAANLRYSVHFGTYALIFSIAVAMGLLFYFFKSDLNFIEKSPVLKTLAYVWIAQNAVMVLAVASRNYLYINHHGLAYKRIGVIFFLLLVLFGLYTMFLKVRNQKTFNYLFHLNTWAVYGIFILISAFNWDNFITSYNLKNTDRDKLDASFLINDISDKNLKTLYEYQSLLPEKVAYKESHFWYTNRYDMDTKTLLEQKKQKFLKRTENGISFLSWNRPDAENLKFLKQ